MTSPTIGSLPVDTSYRLPFSDALSDQASAGVISFHTLPIGNLDALKHSPLYPRYKALLSNRSHYELTVTGPFLDSLASPSGVIAEAQQLAAKTFQSDQTLFVTAGSTLSNQIAVCACCRPSSRVLVQKGLHQSFHFSVSALQNPPVYVDDIEVCHDTGASVLNLPEMVAKLQQAEADSTPFTTVIVNSQTYEGVIQKLDEILPVLAEAGPSLENIIIDEAWGAWSCFDSHLQQHTGLTAGRRLREQHNINIVVVHSAHKSLFALRQGSYLHCLGDDYLQMRLRNARYRLHTTSPSYPIISSLDLARAHAEREGTQFVDRARLLATQFRTGVSTGLKKFRLFEEQGIQESHSATLDPTKVWLDTRESGLSAVDLRAILYNKFRIYTSRYADHYLLFNMHIGITEQQVETLLATLQRIEESMTYSSLLHLKEESISTSFIIPYPPGVPLVVPGERISERVLAKLNNIRASGTPLLFIEQN